MKNSLGVDSNRRLYISQGSMQIADIRWPLGVKAMSLGIEKNGSFGQM